MKLRSSSRPASVLLLLAASLHGGTTWAAETTAKPAVTAASTASKAKAEAQKADAECVQGAVDRAGGSKKPTSKSETGTQGAGTASPPKPKCPENIGKKAVTPQ